ncbi:MAG: TatD family hydrolase [Verrucomicrobiales bacterium]
MWIDAHNHLHDSRLPPLDAGFVASLQDLGIGRAVVNGTRESDWSEVARLAREFPGFVIPSFGLHPWHVADRTPAWLETLAGYLEQFPGCPVGEIGLDRWVKGPDINIQSGVFVSQMELAADLGRAVTIHCLKAWEDLERQWPTLPRRPGRCLLHGFTGSPDRARVWIEDGCLLGFGGYALQPRKGAARETFSSMPLENILIETDAPDMAAPEECRTHHLDNPRRHHPGNLARYAEILGTWRGLPPSELSQRLQENFHRWLGT